MGGRYASVIAPIAAITCGRSHISANYFGRSRRLFAETGPPDGRVVASPLPLPGTTAMTQITACIVALTLTAPPVTTSLCAAACGHQSTPTTHCHQSLIDPAASAMSREADCGTAATDVPYVKESVTRPHVAAVSPSTPPVSSPTVFAPLERTLALTVVIGWLAPPLVLRL